MKILKIKIKNINCLRCEWEINFQKPPLSEAGLFAITGATGSGKSTILDAITLALFNKIPRFETEAISTSFIEKSGSIITRNETDSFVEVDYNCTKGIFRSKWTIATNKRGNLRANDMELIDVATGKIIAHGKKDVANKNIELIGLTYDQFIKSILLSQGEFARFLKSKKDERGKLLEDITGMTVYRELGKRAFEKFKEKNDAIKTRIEIVESEEAQLLPKEKEDELNQLIQNINKEIQNKELHQAEIKKTIEIKNQILSIENEIEKYNQDEERENKKLESFNQKNERRIFKHEQLLPHLNEIRIYFNIQNSIKNISEEIKNEEPELENQKKQTTQSLIAISNLIGATVEMQNADEALTKFRDRIIYLMTNKINAEKALNEQKIKVSTHLKKPSLIQYKAYESSNKIDELKTKVYKELTLIVTKTDDLIKKNKIKVDKINEQKELFTTQLKAWEDLKLQVESYSANREKLRMKEAEIKSELEFIKSAKPKLENLLTLKSTIILSKNEVREKREKKLREESFEEDRKSLKQNEPCPLCGSLHHPYIHEYVTNISELTKEFQRLEKEEKKFETDIKDLEKQIDKCSTTAETLQKEMSGIEKEMKAQEMKIAVRKKQLTIEKVGKVSAIEYAIKEVEKSLQAIIEFEKVIVIKRDLEDFKDVAEELALRLSKFENAKKEVESRYKGINIRNDCNTLAQQLNNQENSIRKSETKIQSYKNQLDELNTQKIKIENSLSDSLRSFGYSDISSSFADILPDSDFNSLKHSLSDLEGNINKIKALMQGANERKQQLLLKDNTTKSKEELVEELYAITQQLKQNKENLTEYRSQTMQNESRRNRIIKLKEQVDETRQANFKWELLNKYIGDAQGKSFSTFAQGLTLKKLILLTNERLKKLNDRYLLDIPLQEEDDDLVIIDTYLGEERRSVKTLSGGETFIVSLALALALSDLASKNVKIESLYIDEGFGSLDPESLDTAISTLEQLQIESKKTIGIISHIDSLKERIETQIQLEKNSSGFSKIIIKQ